MRLASATLALGCLLPALLLQSWSRPTSAAPRASPPTPWTQWNPDLAPGPGSAWRTRCGQWWGGGGTLANPFTRGNRWTGTASGESAWQEAPGDGAWTGIVRNERSGESYVAEVGYVSAPDARLPLADQSIELLVTEKDGALRLCAGAATWAGTVVGIHLEHPDGSRAAFLEIYFARGGLNDLWTCGTHGWQPADPQLNFMYFARPASRFVKSLRTDADGWRHWQIDLSRLIAFMGARSKVESRLRTPADLRLGDALLREVNAYAEAGNLFGRALNGPTWARWRLGAIVIRHRPEDGDL